MPQRAGCDPESIPDQIESRLIFEALDDDASGFISIDEWNVWLLDGLGQAPAFRATAIKSGGLPSKMDMMLCCIEALAQDAGRREMGLKKHLTALEQRERESTQVSAETEDADSKVQNPQEKNDNTLLPKNNDDFSNWE